MSEEAGIGHNKPPSNVEAIQIGLRERFPALIARRAELLEAQAKAPKEVNDEETARTTTDRVRQLQAGIALMEETRKLEKQPHMDAGAAIDGFFNTMKGDLDIAKRAETVKLTAFSDRKEAAERLRLREEADRLRAEEERARREAEERAATIQTPEDLNKALIAEDTAISASARAAQAVQATQAKPATLSQVRGNLGGVSSLRKTMSGYVTDKGKLDLNALRPYLTLDDLNKAVRAFVKSGGRTLDGAYIGEVKSVTVR